MKQMNLKTTFMLLAALAATSCSNESDPTLTPNTNPDAVELGITAGVELTKSAINGGVQTGDDVSTTMKHIAVYAIGTDYTGALNNNYAIYTRNGSAWTNDGESKIYLTNAKATIYAYHPAYSPDGVTGAMGTTAALEVTGFDDASTIPVTVFPGGDNDESIIPIGVNNADKVYNGSWQDNVNDKGLIASAPGEVDYMWADPVQDKYNGKTTTKAGENTAVLSMKHAMSMVSFRVYNDGTYKGAGSLTKIVLSNETGEVLTKGTAPIMKIADGTITLGNAVGVKYTRKIGTDGFALFKVGGTNVTTDSQAKEASPKFSILVMPEAVATNKKTVKASFVIDDATYDVKLPDADSQWKQGENNLYTVKLSGTGLAISSVTVEAWTPGEGGGNLDIN